MADELPPDRFLTLIYEIAGVCQGWPDRARAVALASVLQGVLERLDDDDPIRAAALAALQRAQ